MLVLGNGRVRMGKGMNGGGAGALWEGACTQASPRLIARVDCAGIALEAVGDEVRARGRTTAAPRHTLAQPVPAHTAPQAPTRPRTSIPGPGSHARIADLEQVRRLLYPALAHRLLLRRRHVRDVHIIPGWRDCSGHRTKNCTRDPSARRSAGRSHQTAPSSQHCRHAWGPTASTLQPPPHLRMPVTSPLMTSLVGRSGVVELPLM